MSYPCSFSRRQACSRSVRPAAARHTSAQASGGAVQGDVVHLVQDFHVPGDGVREHAGQACGLGLHPRHREALVEGGHHKHVHGLGQGGDVRPEPQEEDAVLQAQVPDLTAGFLHGLPDARQQQHRIRPLPVDAGKEVDQEGMVFLGG